jgi:hypothetical protein
MLDIVSTDKGLLIPRVALTTLNAAGPITTPLTSLLVYNTATAGVSPNNVIPGYYYWDGTKWVAFAGSGSKNWALLGNAGTTPSSSGYGTAANNNFIGTTDAQDLTFVTNGMERMRIKTDDANNLRIGMGTVFTANYNTSATSSILHLNDWGTTANDFAALNLSNTGTTAGNKVGLINFAAAGATGAATVDRKTSSIESNLTALSGASVSGDLRFYTNNASSFTEKMRILSNGNVGIANTAPSEKLDVTGNVRFSGALMPNNLAGTTGQVLVSQGAGVAPVWQAVSSVLKAYAVFSTRTVINSATWTDIGGLSQTITTTGPAIFIITTYGSLEIISSINYQAAAEIRILQNGVLVPNAFQTHDWFDEPSSTGQINHWSFQTLVTVPAAGTYTFKVQAHEYSNLDNFYAGGNTTAPAGSQNQGAMIIQQFDQ